MTTGQPPTSPTADVIVVGSGPVGATVALLLADRGHRVTVVERWRTHYPLPRAIGLDGEGIRVLAHAGLADSFPDVLQPLAHDTGHFVSAAGEVLGAFPIPSAVGPMGWFGAASFHQPTLEAAQSARGTGHPGITVLRGFDVTSLTQDAERATVTLVPHVGPGHAAGDAGPGTLTASVVVGCDGANSVVRDQLGVSVEDLGFAFDWLVVDVIPRPQRDFFPAAGQILDPARPTTVIDSGNPRRRRFEFMRLPEETVEELNRAETAWALLHRYDLGPDNCDLVRHAVYQFRGRWATDWRRGRVVLAGDAAHQMPPFMAQGLNAGLRDAAALAWRLDLVLREQAPWELLDTYTSERLDHVRTIVGMAVEVGRMICITDPSAAAGRDAGMRAALKNPELAPPRPFQEWRLGPGLGVPGDPTAGIAAMQAVIEWHGERGLMDDVLGSGRFVLLSTGADPVGLLTPATAAAWTALGGVGVGLGAGGNASDPTGALHAWLHRIGAHTVLIRPDFHTFGSVPDADGVEGLVAHLTGALRGAPAPVPG